MALAKLLRKLSPAHRRIDKLNRRLAELRFYVEELQSRQDLPTEILLEYETQSVSDDYAIPFTKSSPMVSVCVATYNRPDLLVDRCIRSVLTQTYRNIELVVVGDGCSPETERRVGAVRDDRLRFINLPERGSYPATPLYRWMVAGTTPMNHALAVCKGDFVTHLDDDDEYFEERLEKLVAFAQERRADVVWHPFLYQKPGGNSWKAAAPSFSWGNVTTSSIFYHHWFRRIPWDIGAYAYKEPGDWNRLRKIRYVAGTVLRHPDVLLRHYVEQSQMDRDE